MRPGCFDIAVALIVHQARGFSFERERKRATLFGHKAPFYSEDSRLKWGSGISRPVQFYGVTLSSLTKILPLGSCS